MAGVRAARDTLQLRSGSSLIVGAIDMSERLERLDGLRGVAAVVVLFSHIVWATLPAWVVGTGLWTTLVATSPLADLYDGKLAVSIFFVMSGFVLVRAGASHRVGLPALGMGRILRLSIPIAASIGFAFLCFSIAPHAIDGLRAAMQQNDWLQTFYDPPDLGLEDAAVSALGGVYDYRFPLNPVLWTMRIELLGSLVIYGLCYVPGQRFRPLILAVLLPVSFFIVDRNYTSFLIGAAMYEAWVRRHFLVRWLAWPALLLGLCVASAPARDLLGAQNARILAAGLIVYGVLAGAGGRAFGSRFGVFLGRISFPLYLTHFPLLFTLGAAAYVAAPQGLGAAVTILTVLPASFLLAFLGAQFVDEPVVKLSHRLRGHADAWWRWGSDRVKRRLPARTAA
ncbi:acyltransferase [Ancylobacter sp. 6x-1]|uniref:Acyltransferase n=1 Tax=Ancylobacter crimeensis TaxID=2579147 RepID=A0ABT0DF70_9HYPH|nr:acyltransferase [Ancylobacter crimeensis]MCK0198612.1 acyltransferase [Ancylobacter crimeensis]